MEDQNNTPDPRYVRGFNDGYLFTKYLPELAEKLSQAEAKTPRMEGFADGRKEYLAEKARDKFPDWLKGDRQERPSTKDKGKDLDKS
ncbi:hypothetical protein [Siphonobacter aquaeclarae]|uniref:Uncharacterized protein n=1 Tax=Siphonobacter aquaeclarae TaxID=563176 RepID=A0A1G9YMK0_9BACT|nr:hypothetical protein [Siphonobacter aquaeclarae]SDN09741.1 hypothetical protein SAMN04488090_4971 [Siphonobacter aquaeclarae]